MKIYLLFYQPKGTASRNYITVKRQLEDVEDYVKLNYGDDVKIYYPKSESIISTAFDSIIILEQSI